MISVRLVDRGNGTADGVLEGHPGAVRLRTRRIGDRLLLVLYDHAHPIGSGELQARDGMWRGTCTEFRGEWVVEGRCGSGQLSFSEPAEVAA